MVLPVTAADIDLIEHAAAIIDGEALALRVCSTIGPDHDDWTGEDAARVTHDQWKQTVERLYDLADRMKAKP